MKSSNFIPEGLRTITPYLVVRGAAQAIDFYKKALGAEETVRMVAPDGRISHAELKIGDSTIFLAEEMPEMGSKSPQTLGGTSGSLYLYVKDVDAAFKKAVDAGGKTTMPVTNMFWGDRFGSFSDPFGHTWSLSTRVEELSAEEVKERAKDFYAQMAQKKSA